MCACEAMNPQHKEHGYHARLFATRSDWMQSDVVKVVLFGQRGVCVDVGTGSRSSTQEAKYDCFVFLHGALRYLVLNCS